MKITVLGKGNMGTGLAKLARQAGHVVDTLDSKSNPIQSLASSDLVIIATKFEQALTLAEQANIAMTLKGKTVIDITNPLTADYMGLTIGHNTSAAEEIAKRLPGASVVKAFNTVFAAVLAARAEGAQSPIPVFVAGDEAIGVNLALKLASDMGLNAIHVGALSNARYLEPMAELMIQLGYGLGHGDKIGFGLEKIENHPS